MSTVEKCLTAFFAGLVGLVGIIAGDQASIVPIVTLYFVIIATVTIERKLK